MKHAYLLLLVLTLTGCGYKVVTTPSVPVYLKSVDNQTDHAMLAPLLDNEIAGRLAAERWRLLKAPGQDCVTVSVGLTSAYRGTLQSGADNRETVGRTFIRLSVTIQGPDKTTNYSTQFPLLNRSPETSEFHVDDRLQEETELARRMALQVAAWLKAASIS